MPTTLRSLALCLALAASATIHAQAQAQAQEQAQEQAQAEADSSGWAFTLDEDLLVPQYTDRDRDYSGGYSLLWSGADVAQGWLTLDPLREAVDSVWLDDTSASTTQHSMETGLALFAPFHSHSPRFQADDRPFASLIYWSNSGLRLNDEQDVALASTFTLGVLGLRAVNHVQSYVHQRTGSLPVRGYEKQISDGGELTARYALARSALLHNAADFDSQWTVHASAGYISEAGAGFSLRAGKIATPWWSFQPQLIDNVEKQSSLTPIKARGSEHYFWAGAMLNARAYNVMLQGQFRDSEVRFSSKELNPLVLNIATGYSWRSAGGWGFIAGLYGQSSEVKTGKPDRSYLWGSLSLVHAL